MNNIYSTAHRLQLVAIKLKNKSVKKEYNENINFKTMNSFSNININLQYLIKKINSLIDEILIIKIKIIKMLFDTIL